MLGILILLVGGVITIVVLLARQRRSRGGEPSCGACGYAVAGLETLRCPECGADLREAGIITPAMSKGLPRGVLRVALLVLITAVYWPLSVRAVYWVQMSAATRTHSSVATYSARGGLGNVEIVTEGEGGRPALNRLVVRFTDGDGMRPELVIDPDSRRFRASDTAEPSEGELTEADLADWLQRAGFGGKSGLAGPETIAPIAAHILDQVEACIAHPGGGGVLTATGPFAGVNVSSSTSMTPRSGAREAAAFVALVLWALIVWQVWRRTRWA
jgi:hypothetical protein